MKNKSLKLAMVYFISAVIVLILVLYGWVCNLITIFNDFDSATITGKMILRIIGVFVFPVGGVLGYL